MPMLMLGAFFLPFPNVLLARTPSLPWILGSLCRFCLLLSCSVCCNWDLCHILGKLIWIAIEDDECIAISFCFMVCVCVCFLASSSLLWSNRIEWNRRVVSLTFLIECSRAAECANIALQTLNPPTPKGVIHPPTHTHSYCIYNLFIDLFCPHPHTIALLRPMHNRFGSRLAEGYFCLEKVGWGGVGLSVFSGRTSLQPG